MGNGINWQARDRVTVCDLIEADYCYDGIMEAVSEHGVIECDAQRTDETIRASSSDDYGYGDGYGYGSGYGDGYGDGSYGYGDGCGDGYGDGGDGYGDGSYGYGDGYGDGYGYGGDGYGDGSYGYGDGYGDGYGYGDGDGDGSGYGYGDGEGNGGYLAKNINRKAKWHEYRHNQDRRGESRRNAEHCGDAGSGIGR